MTQQATKHAKRHMLTFCKLSKFIVLAVDAKMDFRISFRRKLSALAEARFILDRYSLDCVVVEKLNRNGDMQDAWMFKQTDPR